MRTTTPTSARTATPSPVPRPSTGLAASGAIRQLTVLPGPRLRPSPGSPIFGPAIPPAAQPANAVRTSGEPAAEFRGFPEYLAEHGSYTTDTPRPTTTPPSTPQAASDDPARRR